MQSDRPISVSSPLGTDVLLFYRMTAAEHLGKLFQFDLDVLSEDHNIKLEDLLGQSMTAHLELAGGANRHFNGIVSQLSFQGTMGRHAHYHVRLHPWTWFLTRTADCRIFQNKAVPDIIKDVFREFGFSDFEDALSGSYVVRDFCVQYRETSFAFISRLMEEEGIYYYFKHEEDRHTLVLADSYGAHSPVSGYAEVPFFPPEESEDRELDRLLEWRISQQVQATSYTLDDYNFEVPKSDIRTSATATKKHAGTDYKIFDYPGEYDATGVGNEFVKYRLEELSADYETHSATGTARGLMAGGLFTLTDHPRGDQNKEYLVISAIHTLSAAGYESGDAGGGGATYGGNFTAIDAHVPFRSRRATPRPLVQGPQTAVVVGPSGEEIWTDKYGRVKLQFHWDRYGESNENSSCWVRVAQVWAGKNWGAMHIPRIGQEVVVDFLEGDPDRPIITGRVYNADQVPPYALPDNQTQSGVKSRSTKGGTGANFNEIRMEDKKGSEELYIHAEKDENIVVENDKTEAVGRDETITIGNDRTETVNHDETLTVVANRTRSVHKNESITVALMRTHTVGVNEMINVGAAQEVTVGAARTLTVGAAQVTTVGGSHTESIGADHSEDVGKNHTQSVSDNQTVTAGKNRQVDIGENDSLKVGKNILVEAGDSITLKTGKATISMKKDGTIKIDGKDITINGSGAINVKASKDVVMKGKKILQN